MTQLLLEADVSLLLCLSGCRGGIVGRSTCSGKHNRRQYLATYIKVEHHISEESPGRQKKQRRRESTCDERPCFNKVKGITEESTEDTAHAFCF